MAWQLRFLITAAYDIMRLCIFFFYTLNAYIFCSICVTTANYVYHLMFNLESHQITASKIMTVVHFHPGLNNT